MTATNWGICRFFDGARAWIKLQPPRGFPDIIARHCSHPPGEPKREHRFAKIRMLQANAAEYEEIRVG